MRGSRALIAVVVVGAAVVAALGALGGSVLADVLLYGSPFLVIAGLLLNGRFVGERRILARLAGPAPRARRAAPARWPRLAQIALSCALDRAPWSLRGPPAELAF